MGIATRGLTHQIAVTFAVEIQHRGLPEESSAFRSGNGRW